MTLTAEFLQSYLETVENLPHPSWRKLWDWSVTQVPADARHAFWSDVVRIWLELLKSRLGEKYQVTRSEGCFLLSGASVADPYGLLRFIDSTFRAVQDMIPAPPQTREKVGPRLVVVFGDDDEYYSYISRYFPDGRHISSAGVQIRQGYAHIVIKDTDRRLREHLAHELVHLHLLDFDTPRWLEEALAQYLPQFLLGNARFHIDGELVARHKAFWRKSTLEPFWRGTSFGWVKDGSELSYHLSEVLLRNLISDYPKKVPAFVATCKRSDGGAAAARASFGRSLGAIAAGFLGGDPNQWEPHPQKSAEE